MIDTDVLKCKKFCWSLKRSTYVSDILTKKLCHLTAFKTTRWQQLASYVCGHKSTRVTNTVSKPDQHHVAKFKREKMSKELFFSSELTSSAISCGGKYTDFQMYVVVKETLHLTAIFVLLIIILISPCPFPENKWLSN
jgi:hypothetical protein